MGRLSGPGIRPGSTPSVTARKANIAEVLNEYIQKRGEETIVSDLTYDLRSGAPDFVDRMVASTFGGMAVDIIRKGGSGVMTAINQGRYTAVPIPDPKLRTSCRRCRENVRYRALPPQLHRQNGSPGIPDPCLIASCVKLPRFLSRGAASPGAVPPALNDELRRQIRLSFDEASADEEHFPSTIDPRIRHVQVLLEYFSLSGNERILDVGCGKGRYVAGYYSPNTLHSVLPDSTSRNACCTTPLPVCPESPCHNDGTPVSPRPLSMRCMPRNQLEHAVDIERAIAGMCQVLRPGGKLCHHR